MFQKTVEKRRPAERWLGELEQASMKRPTKEELLDKYSRYPEPKAFIQFDGFDCPGDCLADPETGLALFRGETYELMNGAAVRILVDPRTDRDTVRRIVRELAAWIDCADDALVWGMNYNDQIMVSELGLASYRGQLYEIKSEADLEALRRLQAEDLDCPF
jgi:hypothetical protein